MPCGMGSLRLQRDELFAGPANSGETLRSDVAPSSSQFSPTSSGQRPAYKRQAKKQPVIDNRYELGECIGEGAMGVVYRCRHQRLRRPLAIKILRRRFAFDEEIVQRFLNEAAVASAIDNQHVVSVSDCGMLDDGRPYLVMEYLKGRSLADVLVDSRRMRVRAAVEVAVQVCSGLSAAHSMGVVHRDLKPENIHLCELPNGELLVKLLDFGIAKIVDATCALTQSGTLFGTPHYMSPEQARGDKVDQRTDVYALGVLLHEMLCGRPPYDGETTLQILARHRYQPVGAIRQLRGQAQRVSPELDATIQCCLAKLAEERFSSAEELRARLQQIPLEPGDTRIKLAPPVRRRIGVRRDDRHPPRIQLFQPQRSDLHRW